MPDSFSINLVPQSPTAVKVVRKDGTIVHLQDGDKIVVDPYFATSSSVCPILAGESLYQTAAGKTSLEKFSLMVSGSTGRTSKSESAGPAKPKFAKSLSKEFSRDGKEN